MTEHLFRTEAAAKSARRQLIDQGESVSLVAYDSSRDRFVFDSLSDTSGARIPNGATVRYTGSSIPTSRGVVVGYDEGTDAYLLEWGSPSAGVAARIWTAQVERVA